MSYLKCYYANSRSVRNKLPEFQLILECNYDVICLCETFLQPDDLSATLLAQHSFHYNMFHKDKLSVKGNFRGGGVFLCCKHSLGANVVSVPAKYENLEIIAVDITVPLQRRIICAYRPPNYTRELSKQLFTLLQELCDTVYPVYIVGDFNLAEIEWNFSSFPNLGSCKEFGDFYFETSLHQLIIELTRLDRTLDLLLCTEPRTVSKVHVTES